MTKLIECHTVAEHAKSIADYLPNDKLWTAKNINNSTLNNFLLGITQEFVRSEQFYKVVQEQYIPDETQLYLDDWEKALGIPDDCFSGTGTDAERRRDILVKLASLGVQTADDFINLAAQFGVNVIITPALDEIAFPLTFPVTFYNEDDARFIILVQFTSSSFFPYTFPLTLGDDSQQNIIEILECLFNKLKPANVQVIFQATT